LEKAISPPPPIGVGTGVGVFVLVGVKVGVFVGAGVFIGSGVFVGFNGSGVVDGVALDKVGSTFSSGSEEPQATMPNPTMIIIKRTNAYLFILFASLVP
jgi:hypothetical protein